MKGFMRRLIDCKGYYCSISSEAEWLNSKKWAVGNLLFGYKRQITVTEQSGSDLTDYQVLIELNSANFNFSHANSDGSDIRFYDGNNFLNYWIEEWDSASQEAKVWIKIPSIPANSSTSFCMYYGNPNVISASNGEDTFEFFDDFEGTSLDTNKWGVKGSPDYSVSEGYLRIGSAESDKVIYSKYNLSTDYIIELKCDNSEGDHDTRVGINGDIDNLDYVQCLLPWEGNGGYGDSRIDKIIGGSFSGEHYVTGLSHSWGDKKIIIKVAYNVIKEIIDKNESIVSNLTVDRFGNSFLLTKDTDNNVYFDYVFVRKYADPEPSVSIGNEETL